MCFRRMTEKTSWKASIDLDRGEIVFTRLSDKQVIRTMLNLTPINVSLAPNPTIEDLKLLLSLYKAVKAKKISCS
jgi:hypothetical protein